MAHSCFRDVSLDTLNIHTEVLLPGNIVIFFRDGFEVLSLESDCHCKVTIDVLSHGLE